ncbi:hypothetical protein EW146_g10086 [Bondarzewia mesenterica]|uniref:F-box domain-containing protein n=1 Tax=Bondarzewia mesenterica TaxID=1095465 RepID=A0A4S4L0R1_9AGAM|nr:hypothetical protein EW146_g10086 [Bondarzewia mesenterica]
MQSFNEADSASKSKSYWSNVALPRLVAVDNIYSPNTVEIAHARIDEEVDALLEIMSTFKTRRNAFLPICRLPPEIISRIFLLINDPPTRFTHRPSRRISPIPTTFSLGWIQVTHVCRYWRRVALENPSLWTRICFVLGRNWTDAFFERSKSSLITVQRRPQTFYDWAFYDPDDMPVARHLKHLQRLRVHTPSQVLSSFLETLVDAAPYLEYLELCCIPDPDYFAHSQPLQSIPLPSNLFAHDFPRLRHVELDHITIPWDPVHFKGLAHFAIRLPGSKRFDFSKASRPSLDQILNLLDAMPELQTLELLDALPVAPTLNSFKLSPINRVAHMPWLNKIKLKGTVFDCANFIRCLDIPCGAVLSIIGWRVSDEAVDVLSLIRTLASHPCASDPFRSLEIHGHNGGLLVCAWATDDAMRRPKPRDHGPHLSLEVNRILEHQDLSIVSTICAELNISNVISLNLSGLKMHLNSQDVRATGPGPPYLWRRNGSGTLWGFRQQARGVGPKSPIPRTGGGPTASAHTLLAKIGFFLGSYLGSDE